MLGSALVVDVRVISPKTTRDPPWHAYAVIQPIDPHWTRPAREHVFVTYRGSATLGNWSLHLDALEKSLTGDAAKLTARYGREVAFHVQTGTVIELDGERFRVVAIQPQVAKNVGWVEIDALPVH